jgi:hypothetical protein
VNALCIANVHAKTYARLNSTQILILAVARVCTAHHCRQPYRAIPLAAFSAESTGAATATVFLYIYMSKEKQYSNRSTIQLEYCEDRH